MLNKKKKEKEFIITVIPSDEPEYIVEEYYKKGMRYAISVLMNLEKQRKDSDKENEYTKGKI